MLGREGGGGGRGEELGSGGEGGDDEKEVEEVELAVVVVMVEVKAKSFSSVGVEGQSGGGSRGKGEGGAVWHLRGPRDGRWLHDIPTGWCAPLGSGIVEAAGAWRVNRGQVRRARRRRLAIRFLINPFFLSSTRFWPDHLCRG